MAYKNGRDKGGGGVVVLTEGVAAVGKVKVKLSLRLTKHHAMKTYGGFQV
jgi:hypothetical protein